MFTLKKIFPGLPETERGRGYIFKADPKGEKIVYGVANSIIIRSLSNPDQAEIITNHPKKVTAAAYAPSGNYICSGDAAGNLKIWDTINEDHKVKYEYQPLAGNITDICWSEDNARIAAVGMGREKFSCVISWDTGTNIGQIAGQSKSCNTVDFRQCRPYSIVTGGEDFKLMHFKGPPFKYDRCQTLHSNFVNCARYSKDGNFLASAGSDCRIFIYDGKTCEKLHELTDEGKDKAHDGSVYGISWSPCNTKLLSCSADKTCKIWLVMENKVEKTFPMGDTLNDQQLGCLWIKDQPISLSLSGKINFLDLENPEKLKRFFWGHNKGIVACGISCDRKSLVTGSYDGVLNKWDVETGECRIFEGPQDQRQISALAIYEDEFTAIRVGKIVGFGSVSGCRFYDETLTLESEALSVVMLDSESAIVGCINRIYLIRKRAIVHMLEINDQAVSVVAYDHGKKFAIARSGRIVSFYRIDDNKIRGPDDSLSFLDGVASLSISHSQKLLAISSVSKLVFLYDLDTIEEVNKWTVQANRVNCAIFSDDDEYLATSGVDGAILVICRKNRMSRIENRIAHRMYNCPGLIWLNANTLVSFGQQDCTIKFWEIKF